mmetsp:Transcript_8494/g.20479  ORF Transcript_8494/g.20479 Transcript_8494/m.20479 type:complete len:170 (-) Transcript_8494:317-826(-)|eukprot:CAMPEP_0178983020 /NCGR_PEP_ID=MMETSP0795-20121207/816_1 /TAXON_ID=88552 /ORGANISM="Amoebophrya sp., Strain Ameob2" /LENGTH=169 /DNA_ID=CAMNT_0020673723 /DNA_START=97 /DNA_END=606 /DNA_ORIENTATION=-
MSLRRSTSIPAELWPRYKFFSDPETQSRLDADPKRLATIQKDPNTVKWERPSSLVVDASWDKYYFFSDPCVGSSVHLTARKGRSRVAANGPNTFGPEFVKKFTPPLDFSKKLAATTHDSTYKDLMPRVVEERAPEPSICPRIFPNGHVTIDKLFQNPRTQGNNGRDMIM